MTETEITNILDAPIHPSAIKFKVQSLNRDKTKALLVAYADARTVQKRLDDAFGKFGWQNKVRALEVPVIKPDFAALKELFVGYDGKTDMRKVKEYYLGYFRQKFIHSLGIWCEEKKQWVWHEDGADDTDVASIKGGISVSFRRVAVHIGVARGFYDLDDMWVNISTTKKAGQESFYWSQNTYYYNKPKLPSWAAEPEAPKPDTELATMNATLGTKQATWEDLLSWMQDQEAFEEGKDGELPAMVANIKDKYTAKELCNSLIKYFGGEK